MCERRSGPFARDGVDESIGLVVLAVVLLVCVILEARDALSWASRAVHPLWRVFRWTTRKS